MTRKFVKAFYGIMILILIAACTPTAIAFLTASNVKPLTTISKTLVHPSGTTVSGTTVRSVGQ